MLRGVLKRQFAHFFSMVLVASFFLHVQDGYAIYDGERSPIGYSESEHTCSTGEFKFDVGTGNNDLDWKLDNPTCASFIALQGALIFSAGLLVDRLCIPVNVYGQVASVREVAMASSSPNTPIITPLTMYKIGAGAMRCAARTMESNTATSTMASCMATVAVTLGTSAAVCIPASTQVPIAAADQTRCCASYAAYAVAVGLGFSALAVIYASAKGAYENARVCGHDWNSWKQVDDNGDYDSALPKTRWRLSKYPGSRQYCIEDLFVGHENPSNPGVTVYNSCNYSPDGATSATAVSIKNKYFREYLYAGKEVEDGECSNPFTWDAARRMRSLGYSSDKQRYYMTGPGVASNYACHRFILESANDIGARAAYECCKQRSQNTICIENAPLRAGNTQGSFSQGFCSLGSRCVVKGITFETYASKINPSLVCAKTYSVCPYDHPLGGGTEVAVYKTDASGGPTSDLQNFCQYKKHCVKVPVLPYIRISNLESAYISAACRNLRGDSQNVYGFNAEILPISTRGFSAPIVQCFKESIENALLNRAGDTKCTNPDEYPSGGICTSGYFYKKDQPLESGQSFFVRLQEGLKGIIKMALTISIVLLGATVLLGGSPITKKQILMYVLKIGLVMYFALGTGWQFGFVQGILGSSNYLSDIMMRLDYSSGPENLKDGCQFPRFNYEDNNPDTKYNNPAYSPGREYLKIWDTLDCKIARALGFGPELSVPNLVKMIFAGMLTGGLGIMFLVATFIFAFFMIALTLRAIHIFLMASVAIVILIYISPITITLAMFERTKGIFDGWWKQILGLSLQPVILFAYLGIYISLFDNIVIGKATFNGDGRSVPKTISCNAESANTSIYCIFRVADLKTFSGLEVIGIGLPVLAGMNQEKMNTIIKSAFIMFIFAGFMDKISELAATLVGGSELRSNSISAMAMAKGAVGALGAIQDRALRAVKKHTGNVGGRAANYVAKTAQAFLTKGSGYKPSVIKDEPDQAASSSQKADSVESTKGGRADHAMPAADGEAKSFSQASAKSSDQPSSGAAGSAADGGAKEDPAAAAKARDDADAMLF